MFALALQQVPKPLADIGATIGPFVVIMVLAWFLLIRPAQKQRKDLEDMRGALKVGDEVLTIGGLYGRVTQIREGDRVTIKVADNVQVVVAKSAVSSVVTP